MTRIGNKSFVFGHSDDITDAKPISFNDRKYNRVYNQAYNIKYPDDPKHVGPNYNPYVIAKYTNELLERRLASTYKDLEINAKRACQISGNIAINASGCKRTKR